MAHHREPQEEEEHTSKPVVEDVVVLPVPVHHGGSSSADEEKTSRATSCLLPAGSLRSTTPAAAAQDQSQANDDDGRGIVRSSLSFSKLRLSFRLPSTLGCYIDRLGADDAAAAGSNSSSVLTREEDKEETLKQVCRSQSVPMSVGRFNVGRAAAGSRRLAGRLTRVHVCDDDEPAAADDVAAEEAVCRICMVALSEPDDTETEVLKLECCCKGELALAHRACAIKWFSIKGNGACDVCGQEVLNLPVTLHTRHPPAAAQAMAAQQQQQLAAATNSTNATSSSRRHRVWQWHGTPILVIVSMLAYFCFLEQLLVGDHGTAALAISLPFACVLGLFTSLTTAKMVSWRYVWIYSAVQFLFIVLFTNLFYRYVQMQAVIAIILSTFAGFSVAICANSLLLHILRWRARRVASPTTTEDQEEPGGQRETQPPMVDLENGQPLP